MSFPQPRNIVHGGAVRHVKAVAFPNLLIDGNVLPTEKLKKTSTNPATLHTVILLQLWDPPNGTMVQSYYG